MTKGITIRVSEELKTKFNVYCAKNQITATKVLTDYIENLINEGEKEMNNKIWVEKGYTVIAAEHDYDLKKFEVYQEDELVGTIYPDDLESQEQIIKGLNNHVNVNGWADGQGGEIELKRYVIESVDTKADEEGTGTPVESFSGYNQEEMKSLFDRMNWDKNKTLLLGRKHKGEYELIEEKSH